ncbi:MAG: pimeloyl-CoA dehydrogenase large subunit, partial [Hyphomicrobiales bacterium]|nr:pimeloyl-CoA dehydrogenase large subunit [Hyphomicrobiales bacterium]
YLLTHERTGTAGIGFSTEGLAQLKRIAKAQMKSGRPLSEDPLFAARMAKSEIDLAALRTTNLRVLQDAMSGAASPIDSSMMKVKGTVIRQAIDDLAKRALGPHALPFVSEALDAGFNEEPIGPDYANPVASNYFNNRKVSIFAGSNEIQKNIISKLTGL